MLIGSKPDIPSHFYYRRICINIPLQRVWFTTTRSAFQGSRSAYCIKSDRVSFINSASNEIRIQQGRRAYGSIRNCRHRRPKSGKPGKRCFNQNRDGTRQASTDFEIIQNRTFILTGQETRGGSYLTSAKYLAIGIYNLLIVIY